MYSVSQRYKDKIKEINREFKIEVYVEHEQGTLTLSDEDLSMGSVIHNENTQSGDDFSIGGTVASDISLGIRRDSRNLILNSGIEREFDEDIETTVEYYDEFERKDYPWGRNFLKKSNQGFIQPWGTWYSDGLTISEEIIDGIEAKVISMFGRESDDRNAIYQRCNGLIIDEEYTLSVYARLNDSVSVDNGYIDLYINNYIRIPITKEWKRISITQKAKQENETIHITKRQSYAVDIALPKLEKGSTPTPWSPAPEDFNDLKGKQYNLSTTLNKDTYYTLSVEGNFKDDDFIGIWLGNDKFVGYLQDNKITFKADEQFDDDYIIVKSLSEEGVISSIQLELGESATEHKPNLDNVDFAGAIIKPYVTLTEDEWGRNLLTGTSEEELEVLTANYAIGSWNPGLTIGEEYTFSFDIKSENATYLRSVFLNNSNNGFVPNHPISKEWTRVQFTFEWKGGDYQGTEFFPHVYPRPEYSGTYVSRIKLEKGSQATPWTPAPEDWSTPIPLGTFIVDEDKRSNDIITLKGIDNMLKLGENYENSTLTYPATLFQIYEDICSHNNIIPATMDFPNKNYLVLDKPDGDFTFRDILGYVAELAGSFAKFNRLGQLEIRWYEDVDLEITPDIRYSSKFSDENISITGIRFVEEGYVEDGVEIPDTIYQTGSEDYMVDISDNPLLQGDYETVLPNILSNVEGTNFKPYEVEWHGNPAIEAGDMVSYELVSGEMVNTIITKKKYKYGGRSKLEAKGNSKVKKGFEGSTSKKLNQIVRKIRQQDREYNEKITDLENAQLNAMELMANMLGGHLIIDSEGGNIYIANSPNIQDATEYWQWGLGGFVHYKDGVIDTGVTADGSIVAYLVNAGIVTADMVKTGVLQSQDGQTWINLNNGYFNLGNIKYDQNGFKILVHDRTLEDSLDEKINRGDLSVSAENRLYQSKTEIPLRFNEGYSGELQLFRNEFHPYYKVTSSGNGISLFGNFPNSQYAEDLTGEEVTISLDVSADENGTIEIDGEEFDLVENKWTRVYVTKIFPSTNTKNIRVRTLYSKGHSRDIVYGNNLIDNLTTDLNLIYYRNLQVQKGKIPTVHTLTPEEIEEYNSRNRSEIKQLVDSISLMVRKNEIISEINQTAEEIKILAEKISLEGLVTANSNFKILEDGSIEAKNADISGSITSSEATVTGGTITGTLIRTNATNDRIELGDNVLQVYSGANKSMEIHKNDILFYDWEGTTRVEPVGTIFSARKVNPPIRSGMVLANYKDAYMALSYQQGDTYYPYAEFDIDNVNDYMPQYPIKLWKNTYFADEARVQVALSFGDSASGEIWESTINNLVISAGYQGLVFLNHDGNEILGYNSSNGRWTFRRNVQIDNNLTVSGSKNSLQKTKNYGERLINAYETAEYYFGDIGFGAINDDGECVVYIDEIFKECINTDIAYHVFTQVYNGKITGIERYKDYFIVYGEPNTRFSWEIKAKRIGYEHYRLEQPTRFEADGLDSYNFDLELIERRETGKDKKLTKMYDDILSLDLSKFLLEV